MASGSPKRRARAQRAQRLVWPAIDFEHLRVSGSTRTNNGKPPQGLYYFFFAGPPSASIIFIFLLFFQDSTKIIIMLLWGGSLPSLARSLNIMHTPLGGRNKNK